MSERLPCPHCKTERGALRKCVKSVKFASEGCVADK